MPVIGRNWAILRNEVRSNTVARILRKQLMSLPTELYRITTNNIAMGRVQAASSTDEIMNKESIDAESIDFADDIWVFGYGSILWKPGFSFESRRIVYVDGFERQFWQGSISHRGTPEAARTWGMAFHVVGRRMVKACLEHLGTRECHLGGYTLCRLTVRQAHRPDTDTDCLRAITFIALPANLLYLGPASVDEMAQQVVKCEGLSGRNCDYITRLADFVRTHIPEDDNHTLFDLDAKVRHLLQDGVQGSRSPVTDALAPKAVVEHCRVSVHEGGTRRQTLIAVSVRAG